MTELSGQLQPYTLLPLLKLIGKKKLTGMLHLRGSEFDYRVHVRDGVAFYCESTNSADSFTDLIFQGGAIPQEKMAELQRQAAITHRSVDDMIERGMVLAPDVLARWRAVYVQKLFIQLFSRAGLSYQFVVGNPKGTPVQLNLDPVLGFLSNIVKFPNYPYHREQLAGYDQRPIMLSTSLIKGIRVLAKIFPDECVAPILRNGMTIRDLMRQVRDSKSMISQVFALFQLGWIQFKPVAEKEIEVPDVQSAEQAAATSTGRAHSNPMLLTNQSEMAVLQKLHSAHAQVMEATYYKILGVTKAIDLTRLEENYHNMVKQFHVDRFARFKLDDVNKNKLNQILSQVGKAYNTLKDDAKRKEYDAYLELKDQGIPTDVGQIFQADELFNNGQRALKQGRLQEALANFEAAWEKNQSDPECLVYLGWTTWCIANEAGDQEGTSKGYGLIHDGMRRNNNLFRGYLFLGHMAKQEGRVQVALDFYEQSLKLQPKNNIEAEREVRLLSRRMERAQTQEMQAVKEKPKKSGLFDKLFKR